MILGLDYDGTYTVNPEFWLKFIQLAESFGNTVKCVTMRYREESSDMDPRLTKGVETIFTNRKAKQIYCIENKIKIDIWIDDNPTWLLKDSR